MEISKEHLGPHLWQYQVGCSCGWTATPTTDRTLAFREYGDHGRDAYDRMIMESERQS